MKLGDKVREGKFISIVEVFPPSFNLDPNIEPNFGVKQKIKDFRERVRKILPYADAILLADVKDVSKVKISTIYAAQHLKQELGVDVIPVITARDLNSVAIRTSVITAISQGIEAIMFVWGDKYNHGEAKNVYDYPRLASMIKDAIEISKRAGIDLTVFAPINLSSLSKGQSMDMILDRLKCGASLLLAQPPTTDSISTLNEHIKIIKEHKLNGKVLLNIFPFRDKDDIVSIRKKFGWSLPKQLDEIATGGEPSLLKEAKKVADMIRESGLPGIYVSTRGKPELARFILG